MWRSFLRRCERRALQPGSCAGGGSACECVRGRVVPKVSWRALSAKGGGGKSDPFDDLLRGPSKASSSLFAEEPTAADWSAGGGAEGEAAGGGGGARGDRTFERVRKGGAGRAWRAGRGGRGRAARLGRAWCAQLSSDLQRLSREERAVYQRRLQGLVNAVYEQGDDERDDEDRLDEEVAERVSYHHPLKYITVDDPLYVHGIMGATGEAFERGRAISFPSYCVFCHHGDDFMREDNTKLLSQFVGVDGRILPRRLTAVCRKHQRQLARVIKRARIMLQIPHHSQLPRRLRYTSFRPDPAHEPPAVDFSSSSSSSGSPAAAPGGPTSATHESLDATLAELRAMSQKS